MYVIGLYLSFPSRCFPSNLISSNNRIYIHVSERFLLSTETIYFLPRFLVWLPISILLEAKLDPIWDILPSGVRPLFWIDGSLKIFKVPLISNCRASFVYVMTNKNVFLKILIPRLTMSMFSKRMFFFFLST